MGFYGCRFIPHFQTSMHYNDVIMTTIASQITSLMVVCSTVYSDTDQRKHQSSGSLAFVWGSHRDRWIPRTKGQLRGRCFHLMTSSWAQDFLERLQSVCSMDALSLRYTSYRCYHCFGNDLVQSSHFWMVTYMAKLYGQLIIKWLIESLETFVSGT